MCKLFIKKMLWGTTGTGVKEVGEETKQGGNFKQSPVRGQL